MSGGLRLLVQTPEHWRQARDLRLAMLADTPIAYLETLTEAERRSDADWESQHRGRFTTTSHLVAVTGTDGRWLGQMAVREWDGRPVLVAVWLHPDARGGPGAGMMLSEIVRHVRDVLGSGELLLEVHETNARAIAFYRRHGFVPTGNRRPYPLDPGSGDELEMRLDLTGTS